MDDAFEQAADQVFAACLSAVSAERARILAASGLPAEQRQALQAALDLCDSYSGFLEDGLDSDSAPFLAPGAVLEGKFQIAGLVARGGFAEVYLAYRIKDFSTRLAIKILRPDRASPRAVDSFRQERQILADLQPAAVPRLHDAGTHEGMPFMAMDFVEGVPIDKYVRGASIVDRGDLLRLLLVAVETIGRAHGHTPTVVHADLKPPHILVTAANDVRILDFGCGARGDMPRRPVGLTEDFAAPEQWAGDSATPASDVYALGRILHLVLNAVPRRSWPDGWLSSELDAIVARCLEVEPTKRYASASLLARDLRAYIQFRPVSVAPQGVLMRTAKTVARHPYRVASAAVVPAMLLAGWSLRTAVEEDPHRLQVRVVDAEGTPVSDAVVSNSLALPMARLEDSWLLDVPGSVRSETRSITIWAQQPDAFAQGVQQVRLGDGRRSDATIIVRRDRSASIRGVIKDARGRAMENVRVSVDGYPGESVLSDAGGNFVLPAHAANGQQVGLRAEKAGYQPVAEWHPAGGHPVALLMKRE